MNHDIIREPTAILSLSDVIDSFIEVPYITYNTKGRHSDAFVMILTGNCTYTFRDGNSFTARQGDILYLAKDAVYEMTMGELPYKFLFCDFLFEDMMTERNSPQPVPRVSCVITPLDSHAAEKLFRRLLHIWHTVSPDRMLCAMAVLYEIYAQMVRAVHTVYIGSNVRGRIEDAFQKIRVCANDPKLRVSELAAGAGMSEVYFRRLFTAHYGISPSKCIIVTRISYAKQLMRADFFSLEDIAVRAGFTSLSYFCRVFRAQEGVTPAAYRKSMTE